MQGSSRTSSSTCPTIEGREVSDDMRGAKARLLTSTGGDGHHAGRACHFDVIVWGGRIKASALQWQIIAHVAEGLVVEDKGGDPALEVRSGRDPFWAVNSDL